jgi:hypothetical protein
MVTPFRTLRLRLRRSWQNPLTRRNIALLMIGKMLGLLLVLGLMWTTMPAITRAAGLADEPSVEINAINTAWTLIAAFLVFGMQVGFVMLEAGFARSREAVNILVEGIADGSLRHRITRPLHIRTVAHEEKHALFPKLSQTGKVDGFALYGRIIDLEVGGMDDHPYRRMYAKHYGIRYTVRRPDEFHFERAQLYCLTGLDIIELDNRKQAMFLQLILEQSVCEPCRIYRHIDLLEEIRHGAYMILVPVRHYYPPDLFPVFGQVRNVRYYQVYTQHIVLGKSQTAVHNNYIFTILENSNILPYFLQTAQRYYFKFLFTL